MQGGGGVSARSCKYGERGGGLGFGLVRPTFVAETCSCALHIINSIPPNILLCLTIYAYTF